MTFWIENSEKLKYSDFINDLQTNSSTISSPNYNYFKTLIKSLVSEQYISSIDQLLDYLNTNSSKLYFDQNTSGTTSKPKLISVNLKNCLRNIKYKGNQKKSWALCYPVNSFASKQVFFQSLFNKEKIVFCYSDNFKKSFEQIIKNDVSNITCTPTYLNMLVLNSHIHTNKVKTITVGGEKLSCSLINSYKEVFPQAKLINIYASTEAGSLLYSNNDKFSIPKKYKSKVKVINNELMIHKSLINKSKGINFINGWFQSNDKVKMIEDNMFTFVDRGNSNLNIAGFRISPIEIEEKIMEINGISDVRVYAKSNSFLGFILCAEVITDTLTPKNIKFELSEKLDKYKIPQIIEIVDHIKLTKSGKKQR